MLACGSGESAESLATLDRALASPGISTRHRARLLVLAARTHSNLGNVEKARRVAAERARGGGRGGRQLGHGLGAARADAGDRGAGAPDRRAAAVRPGPGRDRIRPGPDRPAPAAADQPGHHAGLPGPVRAGLRRRRAGPRPRGPGRHGRPAGSGALRPGPAAVRNGTVGRGAGRAGDRARGPEGTRRGLLRARHRGRDRLPPRPDRRGAALSGRGRTARQSGSGTGPSASWPWPAAWTASRPARWPRRWPR